MSRNHQAVDLRSHQQTESAASSALTQAITVFSAMFVVALSHADPLGVAKGCAGWLHWRQGYECIAFTGILASDGSAVWNNILDILAAAKVNKEQSTNTTLASANQPPIPG